MLDLPKRDQRVQGVMQTYGGNERSRKIGAHLPSKTGNLARCRSADKGFERALCQLLRPRRVSAVAGHRGRPAERMHPFRQIVKILSVAIPLETAVESLVRAALLEPLTNPKTA